MSSTKPKPEKVEVDDFSRQAQAKQTGIVGEAFAFLRETRKWFLAPIIVLLLVIGLIVVLGGTVAAPFIYTLF